MASDAKHLKPELTTTIDAAVTAALTECFMYREAGAGAGARTRSATNPQLVYRDRLVAAGASVEAADALLVPCKDMAVARFKSHDIAVLSAIYASFVSAGPEHCLKWNRAASLLTTLLPFNYKSPQELQLQRARLCKRSTKATVSVWTMGHGDASAPPRRLGRMIYASPASKFKPPSADEPDPSLVYSITASVKHAGTPDQYLLLRMLGKNNQSVCADLALSSVPGTKQLRLEFLKEGLIITREGDVADPTLLASVSLITHDFLSPEEDSEDADVEMAETASLVSADQAPANTLLDDYKSFGESDNLGPFFYPVKMHLDELKQAARDEIMLSIAMDALASEVAAEALAEWQALEAARKAEEARQEQLRQEALAGAMEVEEARDPSTTRKRIRFATTVHDDRDEMESPTKRKTPPPTAEAAGSSSDPMDVVEEEPPPPKLLIDYIPPGRDREKIKPVVQRFHSALARQVIHVADEAQRQQLRTQYRNISLELRASEGSADGIASFRVQALGWLDRVGAAPKAATSDLVAVQSAEEPPPLPPPLPPAHPAPAPMALEEEVAPAPPPPYTRAQLEISKVFAATPTPLNHNRPQSPIYTRADFVAEAAYEQGKMETDMQYGVDNGDVDELYDGMQWRLIGRGVVQRNRSKSEAPRATQEVQKLGADFLTPDECVTAWESPEDEEQTDAPEELCDRDNIVWSTGDEWDRERRVKGGFGRYVLMWEFSRP